MNKIFYLSIFLTCFGCTQKPKPEQTVNSIQLTETKKHLFINFFVDIDTTNVGNSISCSGAVFKIINDHYAIKLKFDFNQIIDSCYTITINEINGKTLTELLLFDKKDAKQANFCADITSNFDSNSSRKLNAQSGLLIVRLSDPIELYGNTRYHTTVFIKKLSFKDNKTGKKIVLENELLWKVLDLGTPG